MKGADLIVVYMGSVLAEFRTIKKLSSETMADSLGVSQATYSKYENDRLPVPLQTVILITKKYKTVKLLKEWRDGIFEIIDNALIMA